MYDMYLFNAAKKSDEGVCDNIFFSSDLIIILCLFHLDKERHDFDSKVQGKIFVKNGIYLFVSEYFLMLTKC